MLRVKGKEVYIGRPFTISVPQGQYSDSIILDVIKREQGNESMLGTLILKRK